jgi:hypothetical protein
MRARTAAVVGLAALVAAGAPAHAATKKKPKPISKTYPVQLLPYPDPVEEVSCETAPAQAVHRTRLKVSGAGKLVVEVSGFEGDWDVAVLSSSGAFLTEGSGTAIDEPASMTAGLERLTYKSKKAQTLLIDVCNFLGTPNANVKYTYTFS